MATKDNSTTPTLAILRALQAKLEALEADFTRKADEQRTNREDALQSFGNLSRAHGVDMALREVDAAIIQLEQEVQPLGIVHSAHTEDYGEGPFTVNRWGTAQNFIEECSDVPGQLHLYVKNQIQEQGDFFIIAVTCESLRELHQVLTWYLEDFCYAGAPLTLAQVQEMTADDLLRGSTWR